MLETLQSIMRSAVTDDEMVMIEDFEAMLIIASAKLRSFRMWRTMCKIDFEDPVFARFGTRDGTVNASEFIRVVVLEVRLRLLFLRTFLAMYDDETINIFDERSSFNISRRVRSEDLLLSMNANPSLAALLRESSEMRLSLDVSQILAAEADAEEDGDGARMMMATNLRDEMLAFCSRFNRPPDWIPSSPPVVVHTSFSSSGQSKRSTSPPDVDSILNMSPYSDDRIYDNDRLSPFTLDDGTRSSPDFVEDEKEEEELSPPPMTKDWRSAIQHMSRRRKLQYVDKDEDVYDSDVHFMSVSSVNDDDDDDDDDDVDDSTEAMVPSVENVEGKQNNNNEEEEDSLSIEAMSNIFFSFAKRNEENLEMQMHRDLLERALKQSQVMFTEKVLESVLNHETEIGGLNNNGADHLTLVDFVYIARRLASIMK